MIPLAISPQNPPEVKVEEKIDFETKSLSWYFDSVLDHRLDVYGNHGKDEVVRHLEDDTFDVKESANFEYSYNGLGMLDTPYLNINNKIEISGSSALSSQRQNLKDRNFEWVAHHSLLENTQFSKVSSLVMGDDYTNPNYGSSFHPISRHVLFMRRQELQKNINASFDQTIHLRSIKSFSVQFQKDFNPYELSPLGGSRGTFTPELTFNYSDIYIVPMQPDQANGNDVIAKIYIGNTDNSDPMHDFAIGNGKLKTSSLPTGELGTSFELKPNKAEKYGETNAFYLGDIKVSDSTFYDYASRKTVAGFGVGAKYSDTIPYGFKGEFKRDLNIDLNSVFKDVHIRLSKNIERPFMDQSEGKVRLNVTSSNQPRQIPRRHFSIEDIKAIKEKEQTLVGIERLLNEN